MEVREAAVALIRVGTQIELGCTSAGIQCKVSAIPCKSTFESPELTFSRVAMSSCVLQQTSTNTHLGMYAMHAVQYVDSFVKIFIVMHCMNAIVMINFMEAEKCFGRH